MAAAAIRPLPAQRGPRARCANGLIVQAVGHAGPDQRLGDHQGRTAAPGEARHRARARGGGPHRRHDQHRRQRPLSRSCWHAPAAYYVELVDEAGRVLAVEDVGEGAINVGGGAELDHHPAGARPDWPAPSAGTAARAILASGERRGHRRLHGVWDGRPARSVSPSRSASSTCRRRPVWRRCRSCPASARPRPHRSPAWAACTEGALGAAQLTSQ